MLNLFKRLFPYIRRYWLRYLCGFLMIMVSTFTMTRSKYWIGEAVDFVESDGAQFNGILPFLGIIAGLAVVGTIAMYFERIFVIATSRIIEFELRNDFFRHLINLASSFYDRQKTGDIVSRATGDIDQVRLALGPGLLYPFTALGLVPFTLYAMFQMSWPVAIISLLPMVFLPFFVSVMAHLTYNRSLKVQEHFSDFSGRIQESISGIRVIKSFVQEQHELAELDAGNAQNAKLSLHLAKVQAAFFPTLMTLFVFGIVVILYSSAPYITRDKALARESSKLLTPGNLVAFIMLYQQLFFPILRLGWVISALQRASASMHRLALIWDQAPEIGDSEDTNHELKEIKGEIEIRDLTYTYPKANRPSLHGIDIKIPAGGTLGIVGSVGSGKSTIGQLIERLYEPPKGTVFIDGHDVQEYPIEVVRRAVGMVFQETYLFSDTIMNNICFATPDDVDADRAKSAATVANVAEDVEEFPDAYETRLGERGVNVSGGQKQRLALARAIASERPILVLDDAFASVDTNTEEMILQKIGDVMKDRTTLIVSHRISTVQMADEVIVLDDGAIIERGTHDELVAKGGLYADIYERQMLEQAVEEVDE
jgi:ATP-binding cassette, subfamily B, multidrug efflux pump